MEIIEFYYFACMVAIGYHTTIFLMQTKTKIWLTHKTHAHVANETLSNASKILIQAKTLPAKPQKPLI